MIRTAAIWIVALILTLFWGSLSLIGSVFSRSGNFGFRCMQLWARGLLFVGGITYKLHGFEQLQDDQNYLFISNHQSQVDIIALAGAIPLKFGWMAKEELFKIPFLGWHMRTMGYVPINRKSVTSSMRGLLLASKELKEGGSLVIFPEGSRSRDGKLKPFKDGAFYLAIKAGIPIATITIKGTSGIIEKGTSKVNRGEIDITLSDIIEVKDYKQKDREKLKEVIRDSIAVNLDAA